MVSVRSMAKKLNAVSVPVSKCCGYQVQKLADMFVEEMYAVKVKHALKNKNWELIHHVRQSANSVNLLLPSNFVYVGCQIGRRLSVMNDEGTLVQRYHNLLWYGDELILQHYKIEHLFVNPHNYSTRETRPVFTNEQHERVKISTI